MRLLRRVCRFDRLRISKYVSTLAVACVLSGNATAANFFNGESIYNKHCQSCHGIRGQGVIGGAPNFARGQGLMKPDATLYEVIVDGKNAMPAFRGVLKEEEFFDVITYVRSFL